MKFAGKRRKSTEGVTLSGAGHTGATVNGSTLWRRPDEPGAEGATYILYESLRQADREDHFNDVRIFVTVRLHFS